MREGFKFYADAGHAWLAVRFKDFIDAGAKIEDVSGYSYWRGQTLYLEEDCDAGVFVNAYQKKYNRVPLFFEKYTERSPIRSYPQFFHGLPENFY